MSNKYLRLALGVAIAGRTKEKSHHLGAIGIRQDGSVVSSHNTRSLNRNGLVHAESKVIRKAGRGCTLYIVRVAANNKMTMGKPCQICQRVIKQNKVKKVVYSISENEYGVWYPLKNKI